METEKQPNTRISKNFIENFIQCKEDEIRLYCCKSSKAQLCTAVHEYLGSIRTCPVAFNGIEKVFRNQKSEYSIKRIQLLSMNLKSENGRTEQLKDRTVAMYNQTKEECLLKRIPKTEDIYQGLFTIDIGQNDVAAGIRSLSHEQQIAAIPSIVNQFISQIRVLYQRGAKTFWIHNTGQIGCLAITIAKLKDPMPGYLDKIGCVKDKNDVAMEINKQMKDVIVKLRTELSDAVLIYVDMYSAKYELIANARTQGFEDPFKICCAYHAIGYDVYCGNKGTVNGTEVFAGSCKDPSKIISWDGVHYTEAANKWIANRIVIR